MVTSPGTGMVREQISDSSQVLKVLREQRKAQKISQQKVAQFANLSTTSVGEIERGEVDPRFSNLLKILTLFGIRIYIEYRK